MPSVQSPYNIAFGSTAGSVYTIDAGGLALAGLALMSGTVGVTTIETSVFPTSATFGTLTVMQNGVGVGTAQTITIAAFGSAYRFPVPIGPVFDLRVTVVGSVQTAGTLAVYLRG